MKKTILLAAVLSLIMTGCVATNSSKNLTPDEAKTTATEYINNVLLENNPDYKAEVTSVTEENGMFKMMVKIGDREIDSYMTKDGAKFFDRTFDMNKKATSTAEAPATPAATQTVNTKKAKPEVEIYVMSHCPYGTQIEKGIIPAIEALGNKVDFKLKFCDYAMHGEKELAEQMTQYCIQKNEPAKLLPYLKCFLGGSTGDAAESIACVKSVKISESKLKTCVAATDKQFKVKASFADKATWKSGQFPPFDVFAADNKKYSVGGSPTLVINGETISTSRDSASLLKTICSGFETEPGECQAQLSAENPSAGFGYAAGGTASDATCN